MTIYSCLIILILFLPFVVMIFSKKNTDKGCLLISMLAIFLIMALKSTSVGRDTVGYVKMYNAFTYASWNNYDLYWTEWGYETLEMFFTHFLKFDFYQFTAVVYAFICFSYYKFWKRYSCDYTLTLIIYICFGSFVFDLSGIRNALAMAIFLLAVPYAEEEGYKGTLKYFVLVLVAAQIHNSAYVGILFYFFIKWSFSKFVYIISPIIVLISRPVLSSIIKLISDKELSEGVQAGGNVIVYIIILLLPVFFGMVWKNLNRLEDEVEFPMQEYFSLIAMPMRVFYFGVLLLLLAGESTFNRVANFGLFFVTVLLPNSLTPLDMKSRTISKILLYLFLFAYFWIFKISVNELDILPYIFNWK